MNNAAVHTPHGTPVDLRLTAEPNAWRFEVWDQGGEVAPGEEEIVFEPFRGGLARGPGSGLGLAIVRGIAEAHGGSAGAVVRPGGRTTFWVRVPR